jgi:acyl carrier protein
MAARSEAGAVDGVTRPFAPSLKDRAAALDLLRSLMSRIFGVPAELITASTVAADIERWDSLGMATLSLGLERRLNRRLPVEAFVAAQSVAELVDIIGGLGTVASARDGAASDAPRHG